MGVGYERDLVAGRAGGGGHVRLRAADAGTAEMPVPSPGAGRFQLRNARFREDDERDRAWVRLPSLLRGLLPGLPEAPIHLQVRCLAPSC